MVGAWCSVVGRVQRCSAVGFPLPQRFSVALSVEYSSVSRVTTNQQYGMCTQWRPSLISSLSAWRKLGSLATRWAHSEDSEQTGRMPRLSCVFAGRTCHFVGFVNSLFHLSVESCFNICYLFCCIDELAVLNALQITCMLNLGRRLRARKNGLSPTPSNLILTVQRRWFCCGLFELSLFVHFLFLLLAFVRLVWDSLVAICWERTAPVTFWLWLFILYFMFVSHWCLLFTCIGSMTLLFHLLCMH